VAPWKDAIRRGALKTRLWAATRGNFYDVERVMDRRNIGMMECWNIGAKHMG
jgi:hypothetical protein